jgi:hypothetical protein
MFSKKYYLLGDAPIICKDKECKSYIKIIKGNGDIVIKHIQEHEYYDLYDLYGDIIFVGEEEMDVVISFEELNKIKENFGCNSCRFYLDEKCIENKKYAWFIDGKKCGYWKHIIYKSHSDYYFNYLIKLEEM